jgi:hypothetical protein
MPWNTFGICKCELSLFHPNLLNPQFSSLSIVHSSWFKFQFTREATSMQRECDFNLMRMRLQSDANATSIWCKYDFNLMQMRLQSDANATSIWCKCDFNATWMRLQSDANATSIWCECDFNLMQMRLQSDANATSIWYKCDFSRVNRLIISVSVVKISGCKNLPSVLNSACRSSRKQPGK